LGFQPALLWLKNRTDGAASHRLFDSLRGTNALYSNATNAEANESAFFTSLDADGFTVVGSGAPTNAVGVPYISWLWKESPLSGFDIVTYTGNGTTQGIAHGLGVAPSLIIVKSRTQSTSRVWQVYHKSMAATPHNGVIQLNTTIAYTVAATAWNSTAPDSASFTVGSSATVNGAVEDYVAYLFAQVEGFSKFGSYTGNGSADGPFVWLGFRPRWLMYKRTDTTGNWVILDTTRGDSNVIDEILFPNLANAEGTGTAVADVLSNGFKIRLSAADSNASGGTYIFAAFADRSKLNQEACLPIAGNAITKCFGH